MKQMTLTISPNGRVVIPAPMRATLGLGKGGKIIARLEGSTVVLEPIDVAISRAQALIRRYIPMNGETGNSGIIDELIAERHEAARHE